MLSEVVEEEWRGRVGGAIKSDPADIGFGVEKTIGWSGFRDISILSTTEWRMLSVRDKSCEILPSWALLSAEPLA